MLHKKRKDLMERNKTKKYLKYAVGEVVLVVIGILIALSINNWNEYRKERIKEQMILNQLKEDYQSNLLQLEQKMKMRETVIHSAGQVLNYIDHPVLVKRDSLIFHLSNILVDPTFDPIQNDLISSGNLRLIRNANLKRFLSNWTSDIVAVKEMERLWSGFTSQEVLTKYMRLGITREIVSCTGEKEIMIGWLLDKNASNKTIVIGKSKSAASIKEITSDQLIESIASHALGFNYFTNRQSKALKKRVSAILNLIDSELKSE